MARQGWARQGKAGQGKDKNYETSRSDDKGNNTPLDASVPAGGKEFMTQELTATEDSMSLFALLDFEPETQPTQTPAARRREKMKIAYERADAAWRARYEQFILEYAAGHESFIAENCRLEYESRADLPQLCGADKRASGAIFNKLVREGKLKRVGTETSALRYSPMPLYTKGENYGRS
jgi:hypothetical protein